MKPEKVVLAATGVRYYSEGDEAAFFGWLDKIPCVDHYTGSGETLYITVSCKQMSEVCLRELIALFFRYRVDMKQLSVFSSAANRAWFKNPEAYWYNGVFGAKDKTLR
jgi:hypothetical protein